MDSEGHVWVGCGLINGLDLIEHAINGEATTLELAMSGVSPEILHLAMGDYESGEVIGAAVRIMVQPCDDHDQPTGTPEVKFTGRIDNIRFEDAADDEGIKSRIILECANTFNLRRLTSGAVLSDTDQRARSALINPTATPDRFCERVPGLVDKTIVWPRWS